MSHRFTYTVEAIQSTKVTIIAEDSYEAVNKLDELLSTESGQETILPACESHNEIFYMFDPKEPLN